MEYKMNPFAPASLQGIAVPPSDVIGYEPKPYEYIYAPPTGALTANQLLNPDTLAIQTDADFEMAGWYISLFTGAFQVQLLDSTGYQLQSGMVNSAAISQSASDPTVLSPSHPFGAGSKLQLVIQDLSGAPNPLQLVFKGWKVFRVSR